MSIKEDSKIEVVDGDEGTKIKQYFHPHNTLNGINYSIAQFSLEIGEKPNFIELNHLKFTIF